MSLGSTDNVAPVPQTSVPAILSALVASSFFPATVVEAFGVAPVALCTHAPPT